MTLSDEDIQKLSIKERTELIERLQASLPRRKRGRPSKTRSDFKMQLSLQMEVIVAFAKLRIKDEKYDNAVEEVAKMFDLSPRRIKHLVPSMTMEAANEFIYFWDD